MIAKGINLGGWLLMEGYILGGRNIAEHEFKARFKKIYGERELSYFEKSFRENFITEEDFKIISSWGARHIRLPFHYKIFEKRPFVYSEESIRFLKKILKWCEKYNLKVILDLHAACGSQNQDWHSDSSGKALLWENENFRTRAYSLWEYLAANLKDEEALYGYDVLNEPVVSKNNINKLKDFYKKTIKAIRSADKKRLIFLEGNNWAQDIGFLADIITDNTAVSIHAYQPLNFTFNFIRNYSYPGIIDGTLWNKDRMRKWLLPYKKFSSKYKVDIYAGEFGVNYRGNKYGELVWLRDILDIFKEFRFGWTYWTHKAISGGIFPDGIVQYLDNPSWIQRQGPIYGLENLYAEWKSNKNKIIDSWKTRNFNINYEIVDTLRRHMASGNQ